VANWERRQAEKAAQGINLQQSLAVAVRRWPTPLARDAHNRSGQAKRYLEQGRVNLQDRMAADGVTGSLNPTWVEWLMGWPLGWTDLEPWEMARSPSAPPPPGTSSPEPAHENPDFHTTIRG
jgi:DNA (cytosine-5)-methyltransferase 1